MASELTVVKVVYSTLCLFRILIDSGFLRYFTRTMHAFVFTEVSSRLDMFPVRGIVRSRRRKMQGLTYHQITVLVCMRVIGHELVA